MSVNRGKGAALRSAFAVAGGEYVVVQDADLEYDPREYDVLLEPLERGVADVVFGSRFLSGRPHRVLYFWHSLGNRTLTLLSNMFTDLNLSDMESCYKCFRREVLDGLTLREDRFGIEPELTAKVAGGGWRIYEVGISYSGRTYAEGKKIGWRDGVWAAVCIVRYSPVLRRLSQVAGDVVVLELVVVDLARRTVDDGELAGPAHVGDAAARRRRRVDAGPAPRGALGDDVSPAADHGGGEGDDHRRGDERPAGQTAAAVGRFGRTRRPRPRLRRYAARSSGRRSSPARSSSVGSSAASGSSYTPSERAVAMSTAPVSWRSSLRRWYSATAAIVSFPYTPSAPPGTSMPAAISASCTAGDRSRPRRPARAPSTAPPPG